MMNVAQRLAALIAVGTGLGSVWQPAQAAGFDQTEVNPQNFIAIASPIGNGGAHQLLIVEQLSNSRSCWREIPGTPTRVEPLLVQFDFTGVCARSTDSNGYSLRVGGQDLGWRYSLRVVRESNDLVLVAAPTSDRSAAPLEIGRVGGLTSDFAKIQLNPGWRLTRRAYNGQPLGHIYLTNNQDLATLTAASRTATAPVRPTTPPVATAPTQSPRPTPPPVVTTPRPSQPIVSQPIPVPPPEQPRPAAPGQQPGGYVVPILQPGTAAPGVTLPAGQVTPPLGQVNGSAGSPSTTAVNYRVVVPTSAPTQVARVKQLVPGAFSTTVNGQAVMQVGLFRDRATATALQQRLSAANLPATVMTVSGSQVAAPSGGSAVLPTNPLSSSSFNLPAPTTVGQPLSLWATHYYTPQAQNVPGGSELLDPANRSLGVALSERDWCVAAVQGSVQVMAGTRSLGVYTFAGRSTDTPTIDCRSYFPRLGTTPSLVRFQRSNTPYGEGVGGNQVVPYRTIAVDRSVIPIGSVLYIPAARGQVVTLPSGQQAVHDGYFYAADVGSAIKDNHIDVFLGISDRNPFSFVTSSPTGSFSAYLVTDPGIQANLAALHRPGAITARR